MAVASNNDFFPAKFLAEDVHPEDAACPPDLLILNQPIAHFDAFARLWRHTNYRICADGGANRLFDMFEGHLAVQRKLYVGEAFLFKEGMPLT
jgi:thiamine pyrophosphokinase